MEMERGVAGGRAEWKTRRRAKADVNSNRHGGGGTAAERGIVCNVIRLMTSLTGNCSLAYVMVEATDRWLLRVRSSMATGALSHRMR